MTVQRFLTNNDGNLDMTIPVQTSAGSASAGLIPALNASGLIDSSMIPSTITQTIASGTATLSTSSIASGAAGIVVSVAAAGVLATDNIIADFNASPLSTVGYEPSATGGLTIVKYPTAGFVNFVQVNFTNTAITPGAATLNWRVVR